MITKKSFIPTIVQIALFSSYLPLSKVSAEMHLLHREMFSTTGLINEDNPGQNFTKVTGYLHLRSGGPKLLNTSPASADLRGNGEPTAGFFTLDSDTSSQRKLVAGAWFFIRETTGIQIDLISICDQFGNPSPTISITDGKLGGGIRYTSFNPAPIAENWQNRWVYLAVAVNLKLGTIADVQFFYRLLGQQMTTWGTITDGSIGITQIGQIQIGSWSYGPTLKGRMGAPSVYTFEHDDFSDVTYPSDLIEPVTGLTWYCNPHTGNDDADGSTPETAWKTAEKINTESLYTGIFPSTHYSEGDTLIIDTSEAPLEIDQRSLIIQTSGINIRAASDGEWIECKSFRTLPNSNWQSTSIANVYSTTDTQAHVVAWENDKFMHHPVGSSFDTVKSTLSATPGSFWTDGSRLYIHPFDSTDPRVDGKRYERSYNFTDGGAVLLNAHNINVRDFRVGKTCLAHAVTNDPIGNHCMVFVHYPGVSVVSDAYFYYGSKHNFGIVQGAENDDVLIDNVQCEQGSPYAEPGGQTVFVSFNHQMLNLNIIHRYHNCSSSRNAGLIGSSEGEMTTRYPVFYAHNLLDPGILDPFALFEFVNCDFTGGTIQGQAVNSIYLERTKCQSVDFHAHITAVECKFQGMNVVYENWSLTERNCIHKMSGLLYINNISGNLDMQGCTIDARELTGVFGVPHSSLFTRAGPLNLLFKNNAILLPPSIPSLNVFSFLRNTDVMQMDHNAYQIGESRFVYQYHNGTSSQHHSLSTWQSLGHESSSFASSDLRVTASLIPSPGSPLIDTGNNIGPLADHTGNQFLIRDDIGAYETPPRTFSTWQTENFTTQELLDPTKSGRYASYLNDGHSNLLKYAIGEPPRSTILHPLKIIEVGAQQAMLEYQVSPWANDIEIHLQMSVNLVDWMAAEIVSQNVQTNANGMNVFDLHVETGNDGANFFRLEIEQKQ